MQESVPEHDQQVERKKIEAATKTVGAIYRDALKIQRGEKLAIICNCPDNDLQLQIFKQVAEVSNISFEIIEFREEENSTSLERFKEGQFGAAVRIGAPIPEIEDIIGNARENNIRLLLMPGITVNSLVDKQPFLASFEQMRKDAHELINTLKAAVELIVTDHMGRRLSMEVDPGEPWFIEAEDMSKPLNASVPEAPNAPQGEIYKNPKRMGATGILVIQPGSRIDSYVEKDLLTEEVALRIYKGRIVGVQGGESAKKLWQYLQENNKNERGEIDLEGFRIAEVAFGLNPFIAQITGDRSDTVFDEKFLGTLHIAFGASVMLPEVYLDTVNSRNTSQAETHLDFVLKREDYKIEARLKSGEIVTIFGPAGRFERFRPNDRPTANAATAVNDGMAGNSGIGEVR